MKRTLVLGSFASPELLLAAIAELKLKGHLKLDAYSPFPIDGMEKALGLGGSRIPSLVLGGGLTGAVSGYLLQWYCNAVNFPINVGGRPPHSPASFVPITFELTILFGVLGAFLGLFWLLRLPRLYHPVFTAPGFRQASLDRYFVSVELEAEVSVGELEAVTVELTTLGATDVSRVEGEL